MSTERLTLTEDQKYSPLWIAIARHLNERLVTLRRQNDDQPNEAATLKLRGQIKEVKSLLSIADDPPKIT